MSTGETVEKAEGSVVGNSDFKVGESGPLHHVSRTRQSSGRTSCVSIRRALIVVGALGLWATTARHLGGHSLWWNDAPAHSDVEDGQIMLPWVMTGERGCRRSEHWHLSTKLKNKKNKHRDHGSAYLNGKKAEKILL